MKRVLFLSAALSLLSSVACTSNRTDRSNPSVRTNETVLSYGSLVAQLREGGLRVETLDEIQQPFFTPPARVISIGDGEAQVYEYVDDKSAATEAARVAPNGSIGGSMPMWIAPPHFFRKGRLIVLYLGSDVRSLGRMRELLGVEFAGQQ